MKILSGTYKGIRIETTKNASYRPTKSRVRKSIFDILSPFHKGGPQKLNQIFSQIFLRMLQHWFL